MRGPVPEGLQWSVGLGAGSPLHIGVHGPPGLSRWRSRTRATLGEILVGRRIGDGLHMDSRRRAAHRTAPLRCLLFSPAEPMHICKVGRKGEPARRGNGLRTLTSSRCPVGLDWTWSFPSQRWRWRWRRISSTPSLRGLAWKTDHSQDQGVNPASCPERRRGRRKRSKPPWRLLSIICLCLFPGLQVAAAVWSCVCCVDFDWDLKSWSQRSHTMQQKDLGAPPPPPLGCSTRCTPGPPPADQELSDAFFNLEVPI